MKQKKQALVLAIALAMVALVGLVGVTYAYWNTLETTVEDNTVLIGEGTTITSVSVLETIGDMTLVPVNCIIDNTTQVDNAQITYEIKLDKNTDTSFDLEVELSNVKIGGTVTGYENLVVVQVISFGGVALDPAHNLTTNYEKEDALKTDADETVALIIKITLTEPLDQDGYDAVINKNITFDLKFTAIDPTPEA